jgi:L-threonylcarbamoyladenylate synthase
MPDHPIAIALLNELGPEKALAAPSANRFGRVSPTTAAHVREELGGAIDMILDGGPCKVGLESTIVGFSGNTATILRPGGISLVALEEVLHGEVVWPGVNNSTVRVSGSLSSHYAPLTPLEMWKTEALWRRVRELEAEGLRMVVLGWSEMGAIIPANNSTLYFSMPHEATGYGRELYATLRRFDQEKFDLILVEAPPDNPAWLAIADRLQRASYRPIDKFEFK